MTRSTTLVAIIVVVAAALGTPGLAGAQPPTRAERPDADRQRAMTEYQSGWSYMRSEQFDEALAAFQRALDLNSRLNLAHYGKGRSYMALNRYQEAIRAFSTCRDNYLAEAGARFSSTYDANRAREDRLTELQELSRQYQSGPQTTQTQENQRMIQNAIKETQANVARGVNVSIDASVPAFVSLSLGSAYFRAEQMGNAEKEFKAAIQADSKSGEAHNNLAVLYFLTGRPSLAAAEIKAAEKVGFRVNPDLKQQVKDAGGH